MKQNSYIARELNIVTVAEEVKSAVQVRELRECSYDMV